MTVRQIGCAIAGAMIAAMSAGGADAAATRYECSFDVGKARDGNWVPGVLVIQHEAGKPTAVVFDPVIQHYIGKPIDGTLGEDTKGLTRFGWTLRAKSVTRQDVEMVYRFVHYKRGNSAKVTVAAKGYDNEFSADGRCKLTKA